MGLTKSAGNMYDWVSHTHAHLGGECPHGCSYCYVGKNRFGRAAKYTGPIRLIKKELEVYYGEGRTIFLEHCNDLFAAEIPVAWIMAIFEHCKRFPKNTYVFQTKNPRRMATLFECGKFPQNVILGATIESNQWHQDQMGSAPDPLWRLMAMKDLAGKCETFITVEPVMDMDPPYFARLIVAALPSFVNIGADSKGCGLPEPKTADLTAFIKALQFGGVTIRKKANLRRLGFDVEER